MNFHRFGLFLFLGMLFSPTYTSADIVGVVIEPGITIQSDPFLPQIGFFEVFFTVVDTGTPGPDVALGNYNVGLEITPASGITFVSAIEAVDHAPLFPGQNPLEVVVGPTFGVGDNLPGLGAENLVTDGAGMFRIQYTVDAGVSGTFDVTFNPAFNNFADGNINPVPILGGFTNSTITVTPIPEPTSLLFLSSSGILLLITRNRNSVKSK